LYWLRNTAIEAMLSSRFSFLGIGSSSEVNDSVGVSGSKIKPSLSVQTDKDVYRPGDSIFVTIEVANSHDNASNPSILVEKLSFEVKGLEKLDIQWFSTQKPSPGSKGRRGEHIFLDSSTPSLISNQILSPGAKMTLMVRAILPQIIPPSYKGATLRYLYYIKSTLCGRWMALENSQFYKDSTQDFIEVETRIPLQVWVIQKNNGLLLEEDQIDGKLFSKILIGNFKSEVKLCLFTRQQVTGRRKVVFPPFFWMTLVVQPDGALQFSYRYCSNQYHSDRNILERDGWGLRMD
jgi:hypothetical protein